MWPQEEESESDSEGEGEISSESDQEASFVSINNEKSPIIADSPSKEVDSPPKEVDSPEEPLADEFMRPEPVLK